VNQPPGAVLLTGATGFVGSEVLARYLRQPDRRVYALVRGNSAAEATERLRGAIAPLGDDLDAERVVAVPADLERPELGLEAREHERLAAEVTDIVHAAASVSFSLPLDRSREINVDGTRRVLDFAQACQHRGGLRRLSYVSTAYVAGAHDEPFAETDLQVGQTFRNPYERSKFEAERLEAATDWTSSFNVLYTPLKAFASGRLPVLPGQPSAPVDVVPVDYVADAIVALADRPEAGGTYHLVAGERATSVRELAELASDPLDRPTPLLLPPGPYRRLLHPLLKRRSNERRRRALERLETFFPYFDMDVTYDDRRTRRALAASGIEAPPIGGYFGRLMEFARRSQWGRRRLRRDHRSL
jgi:nucleoside-diphosphate-sugar epimerase